MSIVLTLLSQEPYLVLPRHWVGWLGLFALFFGVLWLLWRWRHHNGKLSLIHWGLFVGFLIITPITSLFFGIQLPSFGALPAPGLPLEPLGPALMFFTAVPWFLAAGLFGPTIAALLGSVAGLVLGLWSTHNPFTIFEMALLATLLAVAFRQRYTAWGFRLLRQPILSALALAFGYPFLFQIDNILSLVSTTPQTGSLAVSLDYALTHTAAVSLAVCCELIIAGVVSQVCMLILPKAWGGVHREDEISSPAARSLEARFVYTMAPLFIVLALALIAGTWIVVGGVAKGMYRDRMQSSAETAAENVYYFLEVGQDLIVHLAANPRLYLTPPVDLPLVLQESYYTIPFFEQMIFFNEKGALIGGFPAISSEAISLEETMGVELALSGVLVQSYPIPPDSGDQGAGISFITAVRDENGMVRGVLIGRTNLARNPFTQPLIASLRSILPMEGEAYLLDENRQVLYYLSAEGLAESILMSSYNGVIPPDEKPFYSQTASDGTRHLLYYQPTIGRPWSVVLSVPARKVQELALNIALPLLGLILVIFLVAFLILQVGLRVITASLRTLAAESDRIAQGQLDHVLVATGEDEIGRLTRSFEKMRQSLKARLEELSLLLTVSQAVASTLDMETSVLPVLEAVIAKGASAARIILDSAILPDVAWTRVGGGKAFDENSGFLIHCGVGPHSEDYSYLDSQVLEMMRRKDQVVLTNPARARVLHFKIEEEESPHIPASLAAVALRYENLYLGTLWATYEQPHQFSEEEVRFMMTLGSQAALAVSNARLFLNTEISRQRLAAILSSTPDAVLVTDHQNRLMLANPAALQVLGLGLASDEGRPIEEVITHKDLLNILRLPDEEKALDDETMSAEVLLPADRVYLATASTIHVENRRVGRVCILQDVTHFKTLDTLKSDFVATVSHDLRAPLTRIRGYATMLEMVGELNEQQIDYVKKIMAAIESTSRLVNNLLDLGRIEAGVGLQVEKLNVCEVIEQVVVGFQLQANQKQIRLDFASALTDDERSLVIEADRQLLQQAMHNLIENAIKYTESGGKIQVKVEGTTSEKGDDCVLLSVRDSGIGIAPVDQAHLFEKFYRVARRGKSSQHGMGLGLAIVKSIAERHGGKVWLESHLGKGSTFYFLIPVKQ